MDGGRLTWITATCRKILYEVIVKFSTGGPKVKRAAGSEEEHKRIAGKDAAEIEGLARWILKQ